MSFLGSPKWLKDLNIRPETAERKLAWYALTRWTWVWISFRSWWWIGKPGVLQSMGLQRVRHNWATELKLLVIGLGDDFWIWCKKQSQTNKKQVELHQGKNFLHSKVKVKSLSRVWLFATPWTVAYQALPSMGFSRQEYWSGLPFP